MPARMPNIMKNILKKCSSRNHRGKPEYTAPSVPDPDTRHHALLGRQPLAHPDPVIRSAQAGFERIVHLYGLVSLLGNARLHRAVEGRGCPPRYPCGSAPTVAVCVGSAVSVIEPGDCRACSWRSAAGSSRSGLAYLPQALFSIPPGGCLPCSTESLKNLLKGTPRTDVTSRCPGGRTKGVRGLMGRPG